jgi:hypothetical protein
MARNNRTTGPEFYNQRGEELINILENQLRNAWENTTSIRWILQILREEYPDIYNERQDLITRARSAIGELHAESRTWQKKNPERFINEGKHYIKSWEVRVARESLIDPRWNSYLKTMRSRIWTSPQSKKEVSDSIINTLLSSDGLPLTRGDDINEVSKLTLSGNKIEWYNIQNISVNTGDYLKISNGKVFLHETHRRKIEVWKVMSWFWNPVKWPLETKPQISTAPIIYPSSINASSENITFDSLKKSIDGFKLSENNGGLEERKKLALGLIARYLVHNSIRTKKTLSFQYTWEKISFENGNSLSFPWIQETSINDAVHQYFLITYFKNHFSSENIYDYFAKKLTNPKQNYDKLKTDLEDGKRVEEIIKKSIPWLEPILSYYGESKLKDVWILIKTKMFLGGNSQMLSQLSFEDRIIPESMRANWDSVNPAAKWILVYWGGLYLGFKALSWLWGQITEFGIFKTIFSIAWIEVLWHLVTWYSPTWAWINAVASIFSWWTDEKKYNALKWTLQSTQKEMDLGNFKWLALWLLSQSNNFVDLAWIESGKWDEYQNKSIEMICKIENISKSDLRKKIEEGRNWIISGLNLQNITPQDISQIWGSNNFAWKLAIAIKRKDIIESFITNNLSKVPQGTSENDFKKKFADSFRKFIRTWEPIEIDLWTQLWSGGKVKLESNDSPVNTLSPSVSPQENETEIKKEIIAFIEALKSFSNMDSTSFEWEISKLAQKLNKPKEVVKAMVQKEIDGKLSDLKLWYENPAKEINLWDLERVSWNSFKEKYEIVKTRIINIVTLNKSGTFDSIGETWWNIREKLAPQFKEYLISWTPQEFDVKEVFGVEWVGKITIR